ncbi:MAG: 2-keto-4-pentenoate hydratase [Burkholderiales bacterium]|nr:2-keto-4-pentenoate hydratase [Burkholderiales bacterium]
MTSPGTEAAAQFLAAARRRGTPGSRIPEASRPGSVDDALAVQARVTELLGQSIGGYKCSAPNELRPVWMAPIYAPAIGSGPSYAVDDSRAAVQIEPEVAWVIGRDLAHPGSDDDIRNAIREARLALEVLGSRYADYGKPEIAAIENIADNLANQGLILGPIVRDPFARRLDAFPVTVRAPAGVVVAREGKHPDGHPFPPLAWLARFLAQRGTPLRAGAVVTCGSYCGAVEVPFDTPLTVEWGELGSMTVTLTRR